MTITPITPARFQCGTVSEFEAALSNAVAGDTITLADGVYRLTVNVTNSSFAANQAAGFAGMEGITIRGASGHRDTVVLTGAAADTGGWGLLLTGAQLWAGFAHLSFNFSNQLSSFLAGDGKLRLEDVTLAGPQRVYGTLLSRGADREAMETLFLRVQCDHSSNDCFSFWAWWRDPAKRQRLVDCVGFNAGGDDNAQVLTTHHGLPVEVYGGSYRDAPANIVANGDGSFYSFFTRFGGSGCVADSGLFGCTVATTGNPVGVAIAPQAYSGGSNTYVLFSRLCSVAVSQAQIGNTTNCPLGHSLFSAEPQGRGWLGMHGGCLATGNVLAGGDDGCLLDYFSSNTNDVRLTGNTFLFSACGLSYQSPNYRLFVTNNAFYGNDVSLALASACNNDFFSDYNTYDPVCVANSAAVFGANDTTNVDAAIDPATLRPVAGGNADDTGLGYGWCGDSDPFGLVWLFHPARAPRGARAVQRVYPDSVLFPDAW
jgi:hypothetical protein